ncbi:MAG: hypothetical protein MUO30_06780, partial [Anaerolineales bacterium]|nr:hypothetical protein [Anaerolineales bacterium]
MTAALVIALLLSPFNALASVWSDKSGYGPGSVVTIQGDNSDGAGYLPGETVHVDVIGPNDYSASCDASVDDTGAWSCQVTLAADESAVGEYTYTATGLTSGVSQGGTFAGVGFTRLPDVPTPTDPPVVTDIPTSTPVPAASISSIIVRLVAGLSLDEQQQVIGRNGGSEVSSVPVLRMHIIEVPTDNVTEALARYR